MKLHRTLRVLASAGIAAGLVAGTASLAGAWTQPAGQDWAYWSPGPPPGNSGANDCYVTTGNGVISAPYSKIFPLYGYGSTCVAGATDLLETNGSTTREAGAVGAPANAWAFSIGDTGWAVYQAYYAADGVYCCDQTWEASWLG